MQAFFVPRVEAFRDIMVQEYGRYFGTPTCCLRGSCLTCQNHSGVELHGFLSFLVRYNVEQRTYKYFGYKGKQVRDNIHSFDEVCFIDCFVAEPRTAEVYNIGGERANSLSILEAFAAVSRIFRKAMKYEYLEASRVGDYVCYISDLSKMKTHYSQWGISKDLTTRLTEIHQARVNRMPGPASRIAPAVSSVGQ